MALLLLLPPKLLLDNLSLLHVSVKREAMPALTPAEAAPYTPRVERLPTVVAHVWVEAPFGHGRSRASDFRALGYPAGDVVDVSVSRSRRCRDLPGPRSDDNRLAC